LSLSGSTLSGNGVQSANQFLLTGALDFPRSSGGGAIFSYGRGTITNSTITANYSAFDGGGIYEFGDPFAGQLALTNLTIFQNAARRQGGTFTTLVLMAAYCLPTVSWRVALLQSEMTSRTMVVFGLVTIT